MTNKERLKGRWGADRMEADAFIMTQLMHTEIAVSNVTGAVIGIGLGLGAAILGFREIAYWIGAALFMVATFQGIDIRNRHKGVSKLMERNWDIEDKPEDWDDE